MESSVFRASKHCLAQACLKTDKISSGLWLARTEEMDKKMETTTAGYIGTTTRRPVIQSCMQTECSGT